MPDGRTRLVIGGYQTFRPRWVERFVIPWSFILFVWPMQARMMAVLKRNIERASALAASSDPPANTPGTKKKSNQPAA